MGLLYSFNICRGLICIILIIQIKGIEGQRVSVNYLENQNEGYTSLSNEVSTCNGTLDWSMENCILGPVFIKEDIAENVFYQLCPKPTGRFEAPSSCDLYIVCNEGQLTVNRCPKFYHFDGTKQECVQAELYECSHPVGKHAASAFQDNEFQIKNSLRDKRFIPKIESLQETSRAEESHLATKRFANGKVPMKCPEDFIWPHPYDCTQFQICSNGRIFSQQCAAGTLFNPLSKTCDHKGKVDCTSSMSDYGTYDCQKGHYYLTSHFDDCSKFIECFDGTLKIKECSFDSVFNPEEGTCDFKYKSECKNPISFQHDTDVNYLLHRTTENRKVRDLPKYSCEFNYIAPVDDVCNEFIECENQRIFRKSCGPGTAYNPIFGYCDWPYNVRSPDTQYCSRYLQCDGRRYISKQCPSGTYYNAFNGKCESQETVDCTGKVDDPKLESSLNWSK